jgi:hypothetical protein
MGLEENQEIILWGWGWEEIILTLVIHMVLANRTIPLMKKKWQVVVLVAIVVELMKIKLLKDIFLLIIFTSVMIGIVLKSYWGKSTGGGIVLAIIVGLLMERNLLINMFVPVVICRLLFIIKTKLSLKLDGKEIIILTIMSGILIKNNMWIEMGLIITIYLLIKIYLRIRRMIRIDHNLNRDERKAKYKDYEVICEKNWKHKISRYYCEDCLKIETDDNEKNRLKFGICKECSQPNTGGIIWCSYCNTKHFQRDFDKWTSGNRDIDELIKNRQLNARNSHGIIEWISYNKFTDIKFIAEGGFAKVYSADWMDAYIKGWDPNTKTWKRKERKKVALKVLNDSSKDISKAFLSEVSKRKQKKSF